VTAFLPAKEKYVKLLSDFGLSDVSIVPVILPDLLSDSPKPRLATLLACGGPMAYHTAPLFDEIIRHVQDHGPPELFVADFFTTAARDAADKCRVPCAVVFPNPISMASLLAPELRTQLLDPFRTAVANLGESMLARLLLAARNRERDLRGLPPMLEQDMYPCDFMARPFLATTVVGFEYPFPVPPLLHFVGPTAPAHYPELTGELRAWFNEQWRPVVFVAFGTMHVFKEKECNSLLGALERLSASGEAAVLWSLTEAQQALLKDSARASPRLRIETYVPQYAILSHPKTQVFVSHCGANSVAEALLTKLRLSHALSWQTSLQMLGGCSAVAAACACPEVPAAASMSPYVRSSLIRKASSQGWLTCVA